MTPTLTDDQRHAIEEHDGQPVYLVDPSTNESYVLMKAEQYAKVKALFEGEEVQPRDFYPLDVVEQSRSLEAIRQGLEEMRAGLGRPADEVFNDIRRDLAIPHDA